MILFTLVDYRYRFLYINVGAPGSCNDSTIWEKSTLKRLLHNATIMQSNAKNLAGVNVSLLVIGDSAFRLSRYLMKPYPYNVQRVYIIKRFQRKLLVENNMRSCRDLR